MNTKRANQLADLVPGAPHVVKVAQLPVNGERIGIAAVERDTGLGKDTLRVWERRYGFPKPERDAQGERAYPLAQVQRLRLLRRHGVDRMRIDDPFQHFLRIDQFLAVE